MCIFSKLCSTRVCDTRGAFKKARFYCLQKWNWAFHRSHFACLCKQKQTIKSQPEPQPSPFTIPTHFNAQSRVFPVQVHKILTLKGATDTCRVHEPPCLFPSHNNESQTAQTGQKQWPHSSTLAPHAAGSSGGCRLPSDTANALEVSTVHRPQQR